MVNFIDPLSSSSSLNNTKGEIPFPTANLMNLISTSIKYRISLFVSSSIGHNDKYGIYFFPTKPPTSLVIHAKIHPQIAFIQPCNLKAKRINDRMNDLEWRCIFHRDALLVVGSVG